MSKEFIALDRNPRVARKLIRFNGYIPANMFVKSENKIFPIEFSDRDQDELLKAGGEKQQINVSYEGRKYSARIVKFHMEETNRDIDEVELVATD